MGRWVGVAAVVLMVLAVPQRVWGQGRQQTLEQSVVLIRSVSQAFDYTTPWKQLQMSQGTGSGFIIEGGYILTNAHNVSDCKYVEVKKQNQARRYPARVAFIGHDCDLAVLAVGDNSFFDDTKPLQLGGIPTVNTTVSTYGFPIGGRHVSVTEGVISRIQMDVYSHSGADSHLVIQTDAAINPGNSGGPVIQESKVVGVAFQGLRSGENIGYMIPTTVIRHFLADIEDGRYDSYGSLGFLFYPGLHSTSYKEYLNVPAGEQGIVVLKTLMHSSVESVLKPGDVITHIDEYDIDNDGMVKIYDLTLQMSEVVETRQIGESVAITFCRNGERQKIDVTVALNRGVLDFTRQYDRQPRYVVYAGLTFVPLTCNFLETWGRNWPSDIPYYLRYLFSFSQQINTEPQRKEYVVLSEIMADEVNAYCSAFKNQPVESINGAPIWSLDDVYRACRETQDNGFIELKFLGSDQPLVLDASKAQQHHMTILGKYRIPVDAKLEESQL